MAAEKQPFFIDFILENLYIYKNNLYERKRNYYRRK